MLLNQKLYIKQKGMIESVKKYKILFDTNGSSNWIGGLYYIKNIIFEILVSDDFLSVCDIVILCNSDHEKMFREFSKKATIVTYNKSNKFCKLLKCWRYIASANYIYHYHKYKIDIFDLLEKKAIYWIPDFQECYYPQFFSVQELESRRRQHEMIAKSDRPVVLSSQSAKDDFIKFFNPENKNIYVVPFVSAIENEASELTDEFCLKVLERYGLKNIKYVLVSNQFWQHKNHIVVFEAIAKAKNQGSFSDLLFVFTGELKDYRNTEYYLKLQNLINDTGIKDRIRILGFIDRLDQLALMHKAQLIIQPSLFEGWGTVVEDAKVLDKTIVLSDIPVHREQKNNKCFLFDAGSSDNLIEVLNKALCNLKEVNIERGIVGMREDAKRYSENLLKLIKDLEKRKC